MSRRAAGRLGLLLAAAALGGCGAESAGSDLPPRDPRYRVAFEAPAPGDLKLHFLPREGWHIEPEATAHLALAAPEGFALEGAMQTGEDALEHSEESLAFGLSLQRVASSSEPEVPVRGSIKFGVCRDDATACEIVRRDLELIAPIGAL